MSRFAFVSAMTGYPWGGSESLWSQTAEQLLHQGHDVQASVLKWPETPAQMRALRSVGVDVQEREWVNPTRAEVWMARIFRKELVNPGWNPAWNKIVEFNPDLVCISQGDATGGVDWMLRCREHGFPYVSIVQANFEQWWPDDRSSVRVIEAYEGAARAFFVSRANLELFQKQLGIKLSKSEVVWNPFNVPWDPRCGWPAFDGMHRLACVARLEPGAKGQDLIMEVMSRPKWRSRPLEVSLFGSGPWEDGLKRLAVHFGVEDRVKFRGHVSDVSEIWRSHEGLLLPSRFEGLPLSLVEAMLCGRFGILTNVAGNGEPIENGVNGFLADSPTVEHLDFAMEQAWGRREEWRSMGKAAEATIRNLVPKDPAKTFADQLLRIASGSD